MGNCISCQTVDERTEILKLISEHRNRHGFRRLWPATAVQQEELGATVSSAACICHCRAAVSGWGCCRESCTAQGAWVNVGHAACLSLL